MDSLPETVADRLQSVTYRERAVAYLEIDADLRLARAGGHLENYGLEQLRPGEPVLAQAAFLEGLLPLVETPYFVPCVQLAGTRAADLHFHVDRGSVWLVLLDVTAERDAAQRVQQKAYEMTLLREKEEQLNHRLESANEALRATQRELEASRDALDRAHRRLTGELAEAARYVRSLLPEPITEPFVAEWRFVPSTELGGDAFGYHWIDPDHFAIYLLDVCGHGIGPSLLSVAVLHVLQASSLREVDFRKPAEVLAALNSTYQMERSTDLYFTLWYGVYQPRSRRLDHASAGHPAAVLLDAEGRCVALLKTKGVPIGLHPGARYASEAVAVPGDARLFLMSDGAFEVELPDRTMWSFGELLGFISRPAMAEGGLELDALYQHLRGLHGGEPLEDDFSIVRFAF